ncbi:G-PROTEIN-RECEP-F1-2 domain-containing protein [Aphelenchoides besseyi]|nr:G-PROTEIN-RECEP-F1-2 domain-containing protein [Aphelenchoides besseyi]
MARDFSSSDVAAAVKSAVPLRSTTSPTALPFAAAELAARFAARLLDEQSESQPSASDSKVLYVALSSMLNTTEIPTSISHRTNHSETTSTVAPTIEMTTAGTQFGVVPVIVIGIIFSIATVAGNLMVMISIRLDRQLQTISNYFLFALAFADLTIGCISIPLMTYYTSIGYWGIGWGLCQFWLSIDYLMSNASVLSLLLISFDRYFSITRPLTYRPRRTTRKALMAIFCAYLVSLILWPPWIILWGYIQGEFTVAEGTCVVQFLADSGKKWTAQFATLGTAIAAFYLPVSIMMYLYWRVYRETKRRQKQFRHLQAGMFGTPTQIGATSALHSLMLPLIRHVALRMSFVLPAPVVSHPQTSEPQDDGDISRRGSRVSFRGTFDNLRDCGCLGGCIAKIRGIGTRNAFPNDSDSFKERKGSDKRNKQVIPFMDGVPTKSRLRPRDKISWLRYCIGKTDTAVSSEDVSSASDVAIPVDGTDWLKNPDDAISTDGRPVSPTANGAGTGRFRTRTAGNTTDGLNAVATPVIHSYTVLIEYREGESKRPSVRLSSCDSDCYTTTSPVDSNRSSGKRVSGNGAALIENGKQPRLSLPNETLAPSIAGGLTAKVSQQSQINGKFSVVSGTQRDDHQRKSEKERRKNERRQDSKAAKTLSAILFAFIVTWTPYNGNDFMLQSLIQFPSVIVVWEAFFPNSIPDVLFTISYCLCYINSTVCSCTRLLKTRFQINPICYACNGRFLKTYMRILRCRWNDRRNGSLYRHAYLRRT